MDGKDEAEALRTEIVDLQKTLRILQDKEEAIRLSKLNDVRLAFSDDVLKQHKAERFPAIPYMLNLPISVHISGPFVYGMIIPLAFLDLNLIIFQAVCFRLWGIQRIRRQDHVVVDRHHLAYLNGIEKLNCAFCGYANGVISYARELAARTEQFWCPIKHAKRVRQPHTHYQDFIEFGDADAWKGHSARKKPGKNTPDTD